MTDGGRDEGARYVPVLLEYRVTQIEKRMEKLATAEQVQELKQAFDQRGQRGFTFWAMIVGGPTLSAVIVGVILMAAANAMGIHK
jgi:hypothetical protein